MKNKLSLLAFATLLFVTSCTGYKNLTYFNDMELGEYYNVAPVPEVKIQKDDKIAIVVSCSNPELAAPFNGGVVSMNVESGATNVTGTGSPKEYTVSKYGTILFPILGNIEAEGLTLEELSTSIEKKIIASAMLNDPMVKADFTNFKYTILGEGAKGVYTITENKINIIDALAKAGGVPRSAKNNDVIVIRTENGQRRSYSVNLRSIDLFDSPVYYLQQNDVIYLKPNAYQKDGLRDFITSNVSFGLSTLSMFATAYMYLRFRKR
ncbi:MAG: polysaccharide biosynthesis/export family protein [Bacteroidales bacterium]|nr:polysaccharide biosynthesis/export family protein [Bacteroidales bacterium]